MPILMRRCTLTNNNMSNNLCLSKRHASTKLKKEELLYSSTPQLWATYYGAAIRHKIPTDKFNPKTECTVKQWVVKDAVGGVWEKYDRPAIIKCIGEKNSDTTKQQNPFYRCTYKNAYLRDRYDSIEENRSLATSSLFSHNNSFFHFYANKERMKFEPNEKELPFCEMRVNIDDKERTMLKPSSESWEKVIDAIERESIEIIKHFELDIPYGLALKLKGRKHNFGDEPIKNQQELAWTSISANGQNIITELPSGYYVTRIR